MKKQYSWLLLYITFLLFFTNCRETSINLPFNSVACNLNYSPAYDPNGLTGTENKDGTFTEIPTMKLKKELKIFKPCRKYYYSGKYYSLNGELLSEASIRLVATGRRWTQDSLSQDEVIVQYIDNDTDIANFNNLQEYKSYQIDKFIIQDTIGIVENNEEIWFHQLFRNNQFKITEFTGPILIDFPIAKMDKRTTYSQIKYGSEMKIDTLDYRASRSGVVCNNTAVEQISINSNIGAIENCWIFSSESDSRFGITKLEYQFHEEYGFINFKYNFPDGSKIKFELLEIE